jgi:GcrA cell cycle regulator
MEPGAQLMGWTEERVELLKKLWMEGFSASQIASELGDGVTRNAVIGKVHRLKLSGRAKPASAAPRTRTTPRSAGVRRAPASTGGRVGLSSGLMKQRSIGSASIVGATALKISEDIDVATEAAPQPAELFIPLDQRLTLLELTEHTCKWPIGDPLSPDFYFCGQQSEEGKPYCDFHARRAFHQIDKKRH